MIPQETVNLILDTAQIADVVSDYVTLKRRGANLVACCPFHNEKTPSFYVSPAKGIYKCFGCGKSGSAVGFVMEQEHCSYVDALKYLARKYNIEVVEEEESAEDIARRQRNESLLLVSEYAQKYFREQLATEEGRTVGLAYYHARGLEDDTITRFGLGWAPSSRTGLVDAAIAAGYKAEYLLAAGVAVEREDGTLADKFRERVTFPVHSVSGRVIAFSGRTLRSDNPAKYVNSPETEIYIKSRNLLGIFFAKAEISRQDKCILVEGNMDMVMMHQLGITNVVASCGTSLTTEQIRLIKKFTENVTIMYDGDSAGIHAALRGINMILSEGMNVKIVLLPDGEDPDSFSRKHTLEQVNEYIRDNERDFVDFKSELLLSEAGSDPLKKANLINDIADTIAEISDPIKRSVYVDATAQKFGLEASIIFGRINATRRKAQEEMRKQSLRQAGHSPAYVQEAQSEQGVPPQQMEPQPSVRSESWIEENKTLAPMERELLTFLLRHGCTELNFESDSDYYVGEEGPKPTVADFIREALESDGTRMANTAYAAVYDAYYELYDAGYEQEDMLRRMLDSQDRILADVVAQLSGDNHLLTIEAFRKALTTTESWLVIKVPYAIMVYAERRLQDQSDRLRHEMVDATPERLAEIMQELQRLKAAQRRIKQKTGREKTSE